MATSRVNKPMGREFQDIWQQFQVALETRKERLLKEMTAASENIDALLSEVQEAFLPAEGWQWQPGQLSSMQSLFDQTAESLLGKAWARYQKLRPQQRALNALEEYQSGLDVAVRRLPATVEISGRELVEVLGPTVRSRLRSRLLHWRGKPRPLPLRAVVRNRLHRQALRRAKLDGAYFLSLARATLDLLDPWQVVRAEALRQLEDLRPEPKPLNQARDQWIQNRDYENTSTKQALTGLRLALTDLPRQVAAALLRAPRSKKHLRHLEPDPRLARYLNYWSRQRRAVMALGDLELSQITLGRDSIRTAERTLDVLDSEHRDLLEELDLVIATLEAWQREEIRSLPAAKGQLVPARERCRHWVESLESLARDHLPISIESIEPKDVLPGWRKPWHRLEPQRLFLAALGEDERRRALRGLQEAEESHRAIVREIERAREVVTFAMETAAAEGDTSLQIAREGTDNALSLLLYQKQNAAEVRPLAERNLITATASTFYECHVAVKQGRLGLLSHLAREGGYRSARTALTLAVRYTRRFLQWLWATTRRVYRWCLVKIGWERAPDVRRQQVERRGYLGESLRVDLRQRDLPMIYRRLFRLQPVEDPRFLVGRDSELAALDEARRLWELGRAVAVIIVGQRGSGKTSLLNCALIRIFPELGVLRGQFHNRIHDRQQMRNFLHDFFSIAPDEDLREALSSQRRVVMLEEVERSFLRCVQGTEGLRELLGLIGDTCRSTLWILSMNASSFRFLNAAAGMGQYFSHRINALAVEPEHIQSAILQRHNLSGLLLEFAPVVNGRTPLRRLRRLAGLQENPQTVFFDSLYRQSQGVFRASFELWQRYIDRAEGGILHMGRPEPPDYGPLVAGLSRDDLFTLQAVLQHGSLTVEEHAQVFGLSSESSRNRLERLIDREILEAEPEAPGWRVRPEAGFVVHAALDAENLL